MTNVNGSNEAANIAHKIIAAVMSNEQANGRRGAELIAYMFGSEVTYSAEEIGKYFTLKGSDRQEKIVASLIAISPEFEAVTDQVLSLLEEKKEAGKNNFPGAKVLQIEGLNDKKRAAVAMFTRALTACYHLRKVEAFDLSIKGNGSLFWYQVERKDDGSVAVDKKGNTVSRSVNVSANELVRMGTNAIGKDFAGKSPKPKAAGTAPNPSGKVDLAPIAKTLHDRIRKARLSAKVGGGLDEMKNEELESIDSLLTELLIAKFADDKGKLDVATLVDFAKSIKTGGQLSKEDLAAMNKKAA